MKISVISGGFDPIHSGHIEYINSAKKLGEKLIVALNSDDWLIKKKGKFFLPFQERKIILESIKNVDEVLSFKDDELGSCIDALKKIKTIYSKDEIIFCNGGDRNQKNIPEMNLKGISFKFGVGGDNKKNSSSSILKNWEYISEIRTWGIFYEIFRDKNVKVKELVLNPNQGMSFQRHFHRGELWFVSSGSCLVNYSEKEASEKKEIFLKKDDFFHIKKKEWHQLVNLNKEPCKIIEIQYGEKVEEEDIERLFYFEENN
tara:strand:- start:1957 stop:2733 length:777 start_codon:yes stop_codon:yes gene_type:complete